MKEIEMLFNDLKNTMKLFKNNDKVIKEQIKRALYVQRILFVLTVFEIIKENCPKVSKSLHSPKTS